MTFRSGMSKGTLYLDESVFNLDQFLRARNFRVRKVPTRTPDDQLIQDLLTDRMLVTKNPRHFLLAAFDFEFGLIGVTDAAMADPAKVAETISRAHAQRSLRTHIPFKLLVKVGGKTDFRELSEAVVVEEINNGKKY